MTQWLLACEPWLKFGELLGLLALLWLLQRRFALRGDGSSERWRRNLGLIALSTLLLRLLVPAGAVAFAVWIERIDFGLLHAIDAHSVAEAIAALVVMDLAIYWQHRAFHGLPILWRAHRVHHSDTGFDASLGVRFHPFEILPSLGYKVLVIAVLGAAPIVVLLYEALLLGFSLITHADLSLPPNWERRLRKILVTPDWHRVHHSVHRSETDSNFGNILTLWDHLFGTAVPEPRDGHRNMRIGLEAFRDSREQTLLALLKQPFRNATSAAISSKDTSNA